MSREIKLKVQSMADRSVMVVALANSGYKVKIVEEEIAGKIGSNYYVVFDCKDEIERKQRTKIMSSEWEDKIREEIQVECLDFIESCPPDVVDDIMAILKREIKEAIKDVDWRWDRGGLPCLDAYEVFKKRGIK